MDLMDSDMVHDLLEKKYLKDNPLKIKIMTSQSTDSDVTMYNTYQDSMETVSPLEISSRKNASFLTNEYKSESPPPLSQSIDLSPLKSESPPPLLQSINLSPLNNGKTFDMDTQVFEYPTLSHREMFTATIETIIDQDHKENDFSSSLHSLAVSAALNTLPGRPSSALYSSKTCLKSSNTKLLLNNAAFVLVNHK